MDFNLRDPHHLEVVAQDRRPRRNDYAPFDRVAFAHRVLGVVQPENWTVALYQRDGDFHTNRVRDLRRGVTAVWASIGIPRFATREEIAFTLARLTGTAEAPYVLEVLSTVNQRVG